MNMIIWLNLRTTADMENNVENNARDYKDLITAFGEEKIKSRYCFLERCARRVIENRKIQDYVGINSLLVQEIVIDYFADIKRLKDFHGIERANPIKIAAYTAFWICRRKPLYLKESVDDSIIKIHPDLIDINEWFALCVLISIAFNTKEILFLNYDELVLWRSLRASIHYFLVYRIFTPQTLELALQACNITCMYPQRIDAELSANNV